MLLLLGSRELHIRLVTNMWMIAAISRPLLHLPVYRCDGVCMMLSTDSQVCLQISDHLPPSLRCGVTDVGLVATVDYVSLHDSTPLIFAILMRALLVQMMSIHTQTRYKSYPALVVCVHFG